MDIERISDYAVKMEYYGREHLQGRLNDEEKSTIQSMRSMCEEMLAALRDLNNQETLRKQSEEVSVNLRRRQMQRMKEKNISSEISMMFSQLLTDFERISGHALNIAQDYALIDHAVQSENTFGCSFLYPFTKCSLFHIFSLILNIVSL